MNPCIIFAEITFLCSATIIKAKQYLKRVGNLPMLRNIIALVKYCFVLMQSSETLIQDFIAKGEIKSLAFFYHCKTLYKNSTIFNFNVRKLAALVNLSVGTTHRHIAVLNAHGLLRTKKAKTERGKNLTFIRTAENHLCTINITKQTKLHEIEKLLYCKIIENKVRQSEYRIRLKRDIEKLDKPKARITKSQYNKLVKERRKCETLNPKAVFTDAYFASLFKITARTYSKVKSYLKKSKLIECVVEKVRLGRSIVIPDGCYCYRGYLYKPLPTEYRVQLRYGK